MGTNLKLEELIKLYELPVEELIAISSRINSSNFANEVEFCSIISAKTGKCQENCKYCSQSSHYRTDIETHPLVSLKDVEIAAMSAKENGVTRFSIVTSGRKPEPEDFDKLLEMVSFVKNIDGMKVCASLGILNKEEFRQMKEAGLDRYHHNLNTCKSYHDEICTTHSYQDRIDTVKLTQEAGIEVCAGGIIGMGESRQQRVELALELAELNPEGVPINFLHAIDGTPFEIHKNAISEEEILKTIAIFRIILPDASLKYAGGRAMKFSKKNQELGLKAGINGILVGNYLTTIGISPEEDLDLLARTGMKLKKC